MCFATASCYAHVLFANAQSLWQTGLDAQKSKWKNQKRLGCLVNQNVQHGVLRVLRNYRGGGMRQMRSQFCQFVVQHVQRQLLHINLANAHIRGLEARAEWKFDPRWMANAGLAYAKGDSEINAVSTPLDTINPLKLVLGLRYDTALWGMRANVQANQGKQTARIAKAVSAQFAPASYCVLDLGVFWKPMQNLTVNANLNNALDKKYWRWSDVRGLADNSSVKDAYTAPGRHAQVSVRYDF